MQPAETENDTTKDTGNTGECMEIGVRNMDPQHLDTLLEFPPREDKHAKKLNLHNLKKNAQNVHNYILILYTFTIIPVVQKNTARPLWTLTDWAFLLPEPSLIMVVLEG